MKLLKIGLFLISFVLLDQSIFSKKSGLIYEFTDKCVRLQILEMRKNSKFVTLLKQSVAYKVFKKRVGQKKYELIFNYTFPESKKQLLKIIGEDIKKKSSKNKKKSLIGDILHRNEKAIFFSLFSNELSKIVGSGYLDCEVDKKKIYDYYFQYSKRNGKEVKYPKKPIRVFYKPYAIYPPILKKIVPIEQGSKLYILPPRRKSSRNVSVIGYNVYRASSKNKVFKKINKNLLISIRKEGRKYRNKPQYIIFEDKNLTYGLSYYYKLKSVTLSTAESKFSKEFRFVPRSLKVPGIVQKVKMKSLDIGFQLTWAFNKEKDIIGYNVYRSIGGRPQDKYYKINKVLIPSQKNIYNDVFERKNAKYFYRISAVNKWGNESHLSASVFIDYVIKDKPLPPENLTVKLLKQSVLLMWKMPINTRKRVKGYLVYRSVSRTDNAVLIGKVSSANVLRYFDKSIRKSSSYWYSVRSMNVYGVSSEYSKPVFIKIVQDSKVKSPVRLRYLINDKKIKLYWKKVRMPGLKGYEIYRKKDNKLMKINKKIIPKYQTYYEYDKYSDKDVFIIYSINLLNVRSKKSSQVTIRLKEKKIKVRFYVKMIRLRKGVMFKWNIDNNIKKYVVELFERKSSAKKYKLIKTVLASKYKVIIPKEIQNSKFYLIKKDKKSGNIIKSKVFKLDNTYIKKLKFRKKRKVK